MNFELEVNQEKRKKKEEERKWNQQGEVVGQLLWGSPTGKPP